MDLKRYVPIYKTPSYPLAVYRWTVRIGSIRHLSFRLQPFVSSTSSMGKTEFCTGTQGSVVCTGNIYVFKPATIEKVISMIRDKLHWCFAPNIEPEIKAYSLVESRRHDVFGYNHESSNYLNFCKFFYTVSHRAWQKTDYQHTLSYVCRLDCPSTALISLGPTTPCK